jgi:hypothetical protein
MKQTHKMIDIIKEELIKVSCHPRRILWWNDDPENPLALLTQIEIDELCK